MAGLDYTQYSDCELAQFVVEGDSCAFDTLFARYRDSIYTMLSKCTPNSNDVADLMQDAFMKAYLKIGLYNPQYDFGAWIYTIARNTFVDFSRSKRSSSVNPCTIPLDINRNALSSSPTPEESIINAQQRAFVERCVAMLPSDYRNLFELRFLDEYSYEEIAEKLDMKIGTVKTRIFRVRNMMCQLIAEGQR